MPTPLNIKAIDPEILIEILQKSGLVGNIEEMILRDIDNGFKINEDNTINLVDYCAWLMVQSDRRVE